MCNFKPLTPKDEDWDYEMKQDALNGMEDEKEGEEE